jgi:hypothetical protein
MDKARIAKYITSYGKGWTSANEVASALLFQLVSELDLDEAFLRSIESLPDGIKNAFFDRLRLIRSDSFLWVPFFIGPGDQPADPTEYSEKLRRVCDLLGFA